MTPIDTPTQIKLNVPPRPLPEFSTTEEPVLRRYNRNHELPLSLATSVGVHMVIILAVAIAGVVWLKFGSGPAPVTMDTIEVAALDDQKGDEGKGQNGGQEDGNAKPEWNVLPGDETKLDGTLSAPDAQLFQADMNLPPLNIAPMTTEKVPNGTPGVRIGPRGDDLSVRKVGPRNPRLDRKDRWNIVLPLSDSVQFVRKLRELQVVLVVPEGPDQYRLYDLTKEKPEGVTSTLKGLEKLNRVWYTNRTPAACLAIADELGLSSRPELFAIFIPRELEDEMFRKELAYAGRNEAELNRLKMSTTFEINRRGAGWEVRVREQAPR